jgi:hypothetical protein
VAFLRPGESLFPRGRGEKEKYFGDFALTRAKSPISTISRVFIRFAAKKSKYSRI